MAKLAEILDSYWNEAEVTKGVIATREERPIESIYYGIIIEELITNFAPGGMTMQQTQWDGGDTFFITCFGTREQCKALIQQVIKIASLFNAAGGDVSYDQIYPQVENIQWDRYKDRATWYFYRHASFPILCSINNKNIYN